MGRGIDKGLLILLLVLLPGVAVAWQDCLTDQGETRFRCLAGEEIHNIGNPQFELALAEAARSIGRYDYASVVLERLVIMHPGQAGARLDLVVLSMRAGDNALAAEHLDYLLSLPDPPPVALKLMKQLERRLSPGAAATGRNAPRFQVQVGLGYDDNPNLGIQVDAIELLVDGVGLSLTPDDTLSPDPGPYLGAAFSADYLHPRLGRLQGVVDGRWYEGRSEQDTVATTLRAEHALAEDRYLNVTFSDFRMGDGLYLTRLGFGGRQILGECNCYSLGAGLDLMEGSERFYRSARGKFRGEAKKVVGTFAFYAHGSLAVYRQPYAPWGNTYSAQVGADAATRLLGGRLHLGVSRYNSYDESDYSPLFGGSRRDLIRNRVAMGYARPLVDGLEAYLEASFIDQESSVPLYAYDRFVAELGLRLRM